MGPADRRGEPPPSLTDSATAMLRDRILDLTLPPGARLDEKSLLARFRLSRTPVREAVNRLIAEGLVRIANNRGAFVEDMDLESVLALLDAYVLSERTVASVCRPDHPGLVEELERLQVRFEAALRDDDLLRVTEINAEFHGRLALATGNRYVAQHSAHLHGLARRASFYVHRCESVVGGRSRLPADRINRHHRRIVDCIRERNREELVDVVTRHALTFRQRIEALVKGPDFGSIDLTLTARSVRADAGDESAS